MLHKKEAYVYRHAPRDISPKNLLVCGKRQRDSPHRFVAEPARCYERKTFEGTTVIVIE